MVNRGGITLSEKDERRFFTVILISWCLLEREMHYVIIAFGVEVWRLKYGGYYIVPLQRNPVSPTSRHAQWVRCLHGLRSLLHLVRRRAPYMSLPSFLPCRDFLESWVSLSLFQFVLIFTFPKKVGTGRRYLFWIPAFHSCISYGHLGNIWNVFCQNRRPFHVPLLYK